jgi:hypothetical protein
MAASSTKARTSQLLSLTRQKNAAAALTACGNILRSSVVEFDDPQQGKLIGWTHLFNEPDTRPTAIGTAYGLKLAKALGEHDSGLDLAMQTSTLWKLRREDGGWAARTGVGIGRPEVSALVLGALATVGNWTDELENAYQVLEKGLSSAADPIGWERTYVISAVIRGLARGHRQTRLPQLKAALLGGVIRDSGDLPCWANSLRDTGNQGREPSAPHTAMAIVSLIRANRLLGTDDRSRSTIQGATRWLAAQHDLNDQTEFFRRPVPRSDRGDGVTVRHFTAGWVARALLLMQAADAPEASPEMDILLMDAIRQIWQRYHDGYWQWPGNERPIWMAYQAVSALREFAIRTSGLV